MNIWNKIGQKCCLNHFEYKISKIDKDHRVNSSGIATVHLTIGVTSLVQQQQIWPLHVAPPNWVLMCWTLHGFPTATAWKRIGPWCNLLSLDQSWGSEQCLLSKLLKKFRSAKVTCFREIELMCLNVWYLLFTSFLFSLWRWFVFWSLRPCPCDFTLCALTIFHVWN